MIHLYKDCPATKLITAAAIARIDLQIGTATKKPNGFVSLFTPDTTHPIRDSPETLMFWLLSGYMPRHIDKVAVLISKQNSRHELASVSALTKLLLSTALRIHKKISHIRKMHNDEYYRENRIRITADDEAAVQHLHHLNHSHSDQDVDSNHDDSFDEHEHSD
jgi:hypothetical protein